MRVWLSCTQKLPLLTKRNMTVPSSKHEAIGGKYNFWIRHADGSHDLTHPENPDSPPIYPRLVLETSKKPITIDPAKSALIVVDLQNYFLSPELGRPRDSVGLKVVNQLISQAIPACRKANIPVVSLIWGFTDEDLDSVPPAIVEGFAADTNFTGSQQPRALGSPIGSIRLNNGDEIDGGRTLMQHQWNSELYTPLKEVARDKCDFTVYKNRLSGFWGGTGLEGKLYERGIRTLLFAGANLDQCVALGLTDAFSKGWDCLLLQDGSATTSPDFARKSVEYNCEGGWGFMLTCEQLLYGSERMLTGPEHEA